MDHFFAIVRRVKRVGLIALATWLGGLLVALCAALPSPAYASINPSYDAAMSACLNYNNPQAKEHFSPDPEEFDHCGPRDGYPNKIYFWIRCMSTKPNCGLPYAPYPYTYWAFSGAIPPENPCTDANAGGGLGPGGFAGKITEGMTWCKSGVPDPNTTGATVSCTARFTPSGPPSMNQWGSWHTPGKLSITGDTCDGSGGGGTNNWKNSSGQPAGDPVPPSPSAEPPTNPPPKSCGGGSCYDPTNDNFCAVSGSGQQICIPGNTARTPGGGCASSGDSTICAGSPNAPTPPAAQVPDPPTAVTNHDTWTQANPTTGGNQTVIVNNYTNQGATPTTSGQSSGDSGPPASGGDPAPGSSTATPPGSYNGGGDCNSPPICSGDPVMCGVARQQWTAMCQAKKDAAQLHTDLTGTGAPTDLDTLKSKYGQGDVWSDADTSQDSTVGGQANAGNYDSSGFGYGTACPLADISIPIGSRGTFVIPLADKCVVGDWLRALVLGFALFTAAIITAGGRGS